MKSWLHTQVSLYRTHSDNFGRAATLRDILLNEFIRDIDTLIDIRQLDRSASGYEIAKKELKDTLQCFTPAALLQSKQKNNVQIVQRSGLMQIDIDKKGNEDYDMEELKQHMFTLPCVAFCGLSPSGDGFYALVRIAEPERLAEYAEHFFVVLKHHGITPDTSKGKKVENLRYVSYDGNMLIRDDPQPLQVKRFYKLQEPKKAMAQRSYACSSRFGYPASNNGLILSSLDKIKNATTGQRWQTVQQVSYTLGGLNDSTILDAIKTEIARNPQFTDQEEKYWKCAEDCFSDGLLKPLISNYR